MKFLRVPVPLKLRKTSYFHPGIEEEGKDEEEEEEEEAFTVSIKAIGNKIKLVLKNNREAERNIMMKLGKNEMEIEAVTDKLQFVLQKLYALEM